MMNKLLPFIETIVLSLKRIYHYKLVILQEIGFDSISDLVSTVFGFKLNTSFIPILSISIAGALSSLSFFIDKNVYSPAAGIWILLVFTVVDILVGLSLSLSKFNKYNDVPEREKEAKNSFSPEKLSRGIVRFFMHMFFVGAMHHLSRVWPILIHQWMTDSLLLLFNLITLLSTLENAYTLGWVSEKGYKAIKEFIDIGNIVKKFSKKISSGTTKEDKEEV